MIRQSWWRIIVKAHRDDFRFNVLLCAANTTVGPRDGAYSGA